MHPGYREYMKRVLRIAIQDFKADLIHFDNTSLQAQAPIFFHPMAVGDFRAHLQKKFTPAERIARFGFADLSLAEPPELERTPAQINDPLHQAWADFRCEQLTSYYAEMERYIRGLNPETAVESNPHSGISGRNVVWEQGVDYPRFLPHMDVVWTEEGNEPGVTPQGILISKIRTFKMGAAYGTSIFTYTGGARRGGELAMAEAMAFNRQNLGMIGGALAAEELPAEQRKYVRWYRDNFGLYRDIESRSEVAVLYNYASMAFNHDAPWQSSMLMEQALIQAKIPFDIVFDERLRDLSTYKALILPDQESLSDEQLDLIRAYVKRGGGLVATGQTAVYNQERRRRRVFGLADIFETKALPEAPLRRGRAVYLPAVQPAIPKPPAANMTSQYWKLPVNWKEVVDAVRAASGGLSLDVQGSPYVAAEVTRQRDRLLVHLVNYAFEAGPLKEAVRVSVDAPGVRSAMLVSPDHAAHPLQYESRNGRVQFTIPSMRAYEVAVLEGAQ
jgi:hypothetical protein